MHVAGVYFHGAASYEPRTIPYVERYGGVLLPLVRVLLSEGSYPSQLCFACYGSAGCMD